MRDFFHDVPTEVTAAAFAGPPPGEQSDRLFADPWPLDRWPHVPTRMLQGVDDRFFLLEFQRRIVRERLGLELDEMPGGHLVALSQAEELARRLVAYWTALPRSASGEPVVKRRQYARPSLRTRAGLRVMVVRPKPAARRLHDSRRRELPVRQPDSGCGSPPVC
jgi:hypothetical protein